MFLKNCNIDNITTPNVLSTDFTVGKYTSATQAQTLSVDQLVYYYLEKGMYCKLFGITEQDLKDLLGRLPEVEQWLQRNGSMVVQGAFQKCKIALGENGKLLKLVFPRDSIWKESMERSSAKEDLAMAFSQVCGKQVEFDIVMVPKGKEKNIEYADIRKLVTMDIEEQ